MMNYAYQTILLLFSLIILIHSQLIINVKNQGGDVVQETITANTTDDTIMLEFQRSDGTLITQLIDFRKQVQILKTLILGEEERGQSQYQVMCFIHYFPKDSFISSDAMSKLRQKNPNALRTSDEDLGRLNHTMDYAVALKHSGIISPFIRDICAEAEQATFTKFEDIMKWSNIHGIPTASYLPALKRFPTTQDINYNNLTDYYTDSVDKCKDVKTLWKPCTCNLEQCIGWYPCNVKYCKGKSSVANYRCGIKTCKVCYLFVYYVRQKQQCLWDEVATVKT